MPTERKVEAVEEISEKLKRATGLVVTDYRGLTVAQMQELRRKLSAAEIDYLVVKNTLARRAAAASGLDVLEPELIGPVGPRSSWDSSRAPSTTASPSWPEPCRAPSTSSPTA